MTEEQTQELTQKLREIETLIQSIKLLDTYDLTSDEQANLAIVAGRMRIHNIDLQLFSCFRMMERFRDSIRPSPVARMRPAAPTIDDLEI